MANQDHFIDWQNRPPKDGIATFTAEDIANRLLNTDRLSNFNLKPDTVEDITIKGKKNKFNKIIFNNACFNRSIFKKLTFNKCEFTNCYFIGSKFEDCEFHSCKFINCNLWKVSLERVYLDPQNLQKNFKKWKYANIASDTFQELFKNAKKEQVTAHVESADFHYRKWTRRNLPYKLKQEEITRTEFAFKFSGSWLYQWTLGYGYRVTNLLVVALLIFAIFCYINYNNWQHLSIVSPPDLKFERSYINCIFLTFRNITAFDFAGFFPNSSTGKILSIVEGLFGYVLLSCLISILLKKISR